MDRSRRNSIRPMNKYMNYTKPIGEQDYLTDRFENRTLTIDREGKSIQTTWTHPDTPYMADASYELQPLANTWRLLSREQDLTPPDPSTDDILNSITITAGLAQLEWDTLKYLNAYGLEQFQAHWEAHGGKTHTITDD